MGGHKGKMTAGCGSLVVRLLCRTGIELGAVEDLGGGLHQGLIGGGLRGTRPSARTDCPRRTVHGTGGGEAGQQRGIACSRR